MEHSLLLMKILNIIQLNKPSVRSCDVKRANSDKFGFNTALIFICRSAGERIVSSSLACNFTPWSRVIVYQCHIHFVYILIKHWYIIKNMIRPSMTNKTPLTHFPSKETWSLWTMKCRSRAIKTKPMWNQSSCDTCMWLAWHRSQEL